ncbi:hypothetical protein [Radicibacter daui]|uniref:hypothetical protein n=1 Tax=Radicibacter daui TaxID=3064829 RepID=UPI00404688F6
MSLQDLEAGLNMLVNQMEDGPEDPHALLMEVEQLIHRYEALNQIPPDDLLVLRDQLAEQLEIE